MRDYSQAGEQEAILTWASFHNSGSFVDLGCYDGETYSNTAALADIGWPGICVDAAPDAIGACAKRYANSNVTVIAAAFEAPPVRKARKEEPALIYWTPQAMYTGLQATKRPDSRPISLLVPVLDLAWLSLVLSILPQPLFCSIDLEGSSIDALNWLIGNADPSCICVEANNPSDQQTAGSIPGWSVLFQNNSNTIIARDTT